MFKVGDKVICMEFPYKCDKDIFTITEIFDNDMIKAVANDKKWCIYPTSSFMLFYREPSKEEKEENINFWDTIAE